MREVFVAVAPLLARTMAQPDSIRTPTFRREIATSSFITSVTPGDSTQLMVGESYPSRDSVTVASSEAEAASKLHTVTENQLLNPTTEVLGPGTVSSYIDWSTSTVPSLVVTPTENTVFESDVVTRVFPESHAEGESSSFPLSQDTLSLHDETTAAPVTHVEAQSPTHWSNVPPVSISSTSAGDIIPSQTTTARTFGRSSSSEPTKEPPATSTEPAPGLLLASSPAVDATTKVREYPLSIQETVASDFTDLEVTSTSESMATSAQSAVQTQGDWAKVLSKSHSLPPHEINYGVALGDVHTILDPTNSGAKIETVNDKVTKMSVQENLTDDPTAAGSALLTSAAPALPTVEAATETRAPLQAELGLSSAGPVIVAPDIESSQLDIIWTIPSSSNYRSLSFSHGTGGTVEHSQANTNHEESLRGTKTSWPAALPSSHSLPVIAFHDAGGTHWLSDTTAYQSSGDPTAFVAEAEQQPTPTVGSTSDLLPDVTGQSSATNIEETQALAQGTGTSSPETSTPVVEEANEVETVTQLISTLPSESTRPSAIGESVTVTKWVSIITDPEPKATVGPMSDDIPKALLPAETRSTDTKGMTLIRVGFLKPLNYNFVANNMAAAAQIFALLPDALALSHTKVAAQGEVIDLRPRKTSGYISTMARLYYPEDMLDNLRLDVGSPNSELHTTKNETLRELTALIDAGFGAQLDDGATNGDCDTCREAGSDASPRPLSTVKKVVIAMSSVGGCVVICGVLFILRRGRKRQKRSSYPEKRVHRQEISQPVDCWNSVGL